MKWFQVFIVLAILSASSGRLTKSSDKLGVVGDELSDLAAGTRELHPHGDDHDYDTPADDQTIKDDSNANATDVPTTEEPEDEATVVPTTEVPEDEATDVPTTMEPENEATVVPTTEEPEDEATDDRTGKPEDEATDVPTTMEPEDEATVVPTTEEPVATAVPTSEEPEGPNYLYPVIETGPDSTTDSVPVVLDVDFNTSEAFEFEFDFNSSDPLQPVDAGYFFDKKFGDLSLGDSLTAPPDPHGAAGPSSLIAVVNSIISARSPTAGNLLWASFLNRFFSSIPGIGPTTGVFDPKILYDWHENRFLVVALANARSTRSSILLAVSKTDNPRSATTSDWYYARIPSFVDSKWADYPGFAVDEEAIYITCNMIPVAFGVAPTSLLWIYNKDPFYSGGQLAGPSRARIPILITHGAGTATFRTYQPAQIRDKRGAGAGTYLVSFDHFGLANQATGDQALAVWKISNPLDDLSGSMFGFVNLGNIEAREDIFGLLPNAPQPETTALIETNDKRALEAVWQDDELWVTFTVTLRRQATAYWAKLDTRAPLITLLDKGPVDGEDIAPGTFTYYPSIAVNRRGVAAFGLAASATIMHASAYVTVRDDRNDMDGTVRTPGALVIGSAPYELRDSVNRNRWGDYTGVVVDPLNEDCFWAYNQYAARSPSPVFQSFWATAWGHFCMDME